MALDLTKLMEAANEAGASGGNGSCKRNVAVLSRGCLLFHVQL